ncbi:porin family protein [Aquimarina spinulae]|uniref:porin family protein n=1 Tax=Aquimarina spinulae TaxID=1192023 RepID=UPI000D55B5F3|nr:porin family protein [Aquimarina spinulae]
MKKLFLLAIAVIGFSISSNAQDIKLGFKGGVNFATLNGDNVNDNLDGRTGYHIGAVVQIGLSDMFAVQPELIYSAQGIENTDIDYLNLPVLVKFKFAKFFSAEAGPQFGFVVNDNYPAGTDPESFDLSAAVGAGVEFGSFFGQLRYNIGFTDIVDNVEAKNSVFQVSVGYYIF